MNIHKNARLMLRRREELVKRREAGEPLKRLARGFEISVRTARKWWGRYRAEGVAGLADRSSRPHDSPARTAAPLQLAAKVLRWQHWTGAEIGIALGISAATATRILRRGGLNRRGRLELPPVVERYEHAAVGDCCISTPRSWGASRISGIGPRATSDPAKAVKWKACADRHHRAGASERVSESLRIRSGRVAIPWGDSQIPRRPAP